MPDITNPPVPRPKKRPTTTPNQNIYYDGEDAWEAGTKVYYYYTDTVYRAVEDGIVPMANNTSIVVEDGEIIEII